MGTQDMTCSLCGRLRDIDDMTRVRPNPSYPSEWFCSGGKKSCHQKATANMIAYDKKHDNSPRGTK